MSMRIFNLFIVSAAAILLMSNAARAQIAVDAEFSDWEGISTPPVEDPVDMADSSGDIRMVQAAFQDGHLYLRMQVEGVFAPSPEETPVGMNNRYYYHWILDTDNNPATGFSNSEYEGNLTGLENPIGADLVIQIGWRDGEPDGVYAYNPLTEEELTRDYEWSSAGDSVEAAIPISDLGLSSGQTIAFSAFQEGASDGWSVDWVESETLTLTQVSTRFTIDGSFGDWEDTPVSTVDDPADMADSSGDIRRIEGSVDNGMLLLSMTVDGVPTPTVEETPEGMINRYYYHWILDTDNNPATGFSNSEYEGTLTGLENPIGADLVIQIGWRDGAPDGVYAYDPLTEEELVRDFEWNRDGDTLHAAIPLEDLQLTAGQTVALSAFQEGASDDWSVDWVESAELTLTGPAALGTIPGVEDPIDMLDPSGDIRQIQAAVEHGRLFLRMRVEGTFAQDPADTPAGLVNRYYYHWILDTDNNPATGFSNSEYEGTLTGLEDPIGADLVIQIGWRDGSPDGVYAYDPLTEEELTRDFAWEAESDSVEASIPLEELGLSLGQTISLSAFQEGASDDWSVDWVESVEFVLNEIQSTGAALKTDVAANGYGVELTIEDEGSSEVDESTVTVSLDGEPVDVNVVKTEGVTTASGAFGGLLEPGSEHLLGFTYQLAGSQDVQTGELAFTVKPYSPIPTDYKVESVVTGEPGFTVNVTQISQSQSGETSLHGNQSDLAELQLAGEMRDTDGSQFVNEASDNSATWEIDPVEVDGVINWHEAAPQPTGHFRDTTGYEDQLIPRIPGWNGSYEGIVTEILTYVHLDAGYHTFAVNTTGGYKASSGVAPADQFGPVLAEYNGDRPYSYMGDHYFDIAVQEAGYYPLRVLWFHSEPTNEGAQLELYSVHNKQKILVNDESNPNSVEAYRVAENSRPYVTQVRPLAGTRQAEADSQIEIDIAPGDIGIVSGSIQLTIDGTQVTPTVTETDGTIRVSYDPEGLTLGQSYDITLSYDLDTDPPTTRTETYTIGVHTDAAVLSAEWATPIGTGVDRGFNVRTEQSSSPRGNSTAEAEAQLADGGDLFSGTATPQIINFSRDLAFPDGYFYMNDLGFFQEGLISPESNDYLAMEIVTYLELPAGLHTLGVNSDDGFRVTAGRLAADNTLEVGVYEGSRGDSFDQLQSLFDVIAPVDGVYAFRMIWYQGTGKLSVEWYSYDRETQTPTLINDPDEEGAIKAFQARSEEPVETQTPTVGLLMQDGTLRLEWTGTLQSADSLDGPWNDVTEAESPMVVSPDEPAQFYRSHN